MKHLCILIIRLYRWVIAPVKRWLCGGKGTCRYDPSCSQFAIQALQLHGFFKGSTLAGIRILRCHPWGGHGLDCVPTRISWKHVIGFPQPPDAWRKHANSIHGSVLVSPNGRFVAEGSTPADTLNSAQQGSRDFDNGRLYTALPSDAQTDESMQAHAVIVIETNL